MGLYLIQPPAFSVNPSLTNQFKLIQFSASSADPTQVELASSTPPDQGCFSLYTTGDHEYVKMGNEVACTIIGVRESCVTFDHVTWMQNVLSDVRYIPEGKLNMI